MDQLLIDRPDLSTLFNGHPEVRTWLESCFDGKYLKEEITWDKSAPGNEGQGVTSECFPATGSSLPSVRVTASSKISPMDRLIMLLFELNNILNSDKYLALSEQARRKEVSRSEFANAGVKMEWRAAWLLNRDIRKLGLNKHFGQRDVYAKFYLSIPNTYDSWPKSLESARDSQIERWKRMFDQISSNSDLEQNTDNYNVDK